MNCGSTPSATKVAISAILVSRGDLSGSLLSGGIVRDRGRIFKSCSKVCLGCGAVGKRGSFSREVCLLYPRRCHILGLCVKGAVSGRRTCGFTRGLIVARRSRVVGATSVAT